MAHLLEDTPWLSSHYQAVDAEKAHFERLSGATASSCSNKASSQSSSSLVSEIKKAREQIQKSLQGDASGSDSAINDRMCKLESENKDLRKVTEDLRAMIKKLENRVCALEKSSTSATPQPPQKQEDSNKAAADDDDDDDDIDLFDDDDEVDEEAERIKQQRLAEYQARKAKKPTVIAKSNVILDVKPWDDTTDMKKLEECVRSVEMDGLIWGNSKLVPLAYGIRKLQISCVVEDDKVSTEVLQEQIEGFEDYIQSTDIAAFQKV